MSTYEVVYLTEKDSQVEALAPVLGCKYEKKWYPAYSQDKKIAIVPLQGHLIELYKFPQDYDEGFKEWNDKTVFCFPKEFKTKPKKRTMDLLNRAVEHLKNAKKVIIASDFDNEGAALAMRVIEYAKAENKVSHMLEMGSMDENALKNAIENPINIPYREMANAGYARAYIDWAEGMTLSRAQTLFLARKKIVMVFGGVKSPLINMVVERDLQFENHKSLKYWYLTGAVSAKGKTFNVNVIRKEEVIKKDKKGKEKKEIKDFKEISSKEKAEELKKEIEEKGTFLIENFMKKNKSENPPQLYDLTSLQAELAAKFNLIPEQSLEIAQVLYDRFKIQTYPRTAIKYLKEEEYDAVPNILKNLSQVMYSNFIEKILSNPIPKRKSIFNSAKVTSHGGLAPTTKNLKEVINSLNELQKNTFDLVAKRYVANFMPSYEFEEISGEIHLFDNYYMTFKENKPMKAGYKEIYQKDIVSKIESYQREIPDLEKGEEVKVESLTINEGESKPKARFTMETLLRSMENISNLYPDDPIVKEYLGDSGIGTPATRSAIIKELMTPDKEDQEPWLIQKGKQIISTQRARELIKVVPKEIVSPVKRAKLNQDLQKIEKGEIELEDFLEDYKDKLKESVEVIKKHGEDPNNWVRVPGKEIISLGKCPSCSGDIIEKPKAYICSNAQWKKDENEKMDKRGV
jgi:DNA topoisomerase-3